MLGMIKRVCIKKSCFYFCIALLCLGLIDTVADEGMSYGGSMKIQIRSFSRHTECNSIKELQEALNAHYMDSKVSIVIINPLTNMKKVRFVSIYPGLVLDTYKETPVDLNNLFPEMSHAAK